MPIGISLDPILASLLRYHLKKHYSDKPFSILVFGTNYVDGIGDFIHTWDFYKFLAGYLKDIPQIQVSGICRSNEKKMQVIRQVFKDDLAAHDVVVINSFEEPDNIREGSFVLCNYEKHYGMLPHTMNLQAIINVSLPLNHFIANYVPDNAAVISILEYGTRSKKTSLGEKIINEASMGILPHQMGIKIDLWLAEKSKSEKEPALLAALDNRTLLIKILEASQSPETWHARTFMGCGYLQTKEHSYGFVLTSLALASNRNADLFVNHEFFKDGNDNVSEEFLQILKGKNIDGVELVSNNGSTIQKIRLSENEPPRMLRLINFSGISENDKKILLALSGCVTGSGDTSITEIISTGNFPFFAVRSTKDDFMHQMIGDIKNRHPEFRELIQYLESTDPRNITEEMTQFIQDNHEAIAQQWREYCWFLVSHRDVRDNLVRLVDRAIIESIIRMGDPDELNRLTPFLQTLTEEDTRRNRLFDLLIGVESPENNACFTSAKRNWPENEPFPILELVTGWLRPHLFSRAYLSVLAKQPSFMQQLDDIIPRVLGAIAACNPDSNQLLDSEESWLAGLSADVEMTNFIFSKFKFLSERKSDNRLFQAVDKLDIKDSQLLCKVAALAFLSVRARNAHVLLQSPEWHHAITSNQPGVLNFIKDIAETLTYKCGIDPKLKY